jgi:hypothetical protein
VSIRSTPSFRARSTGRWCGASSPITRPGPARLAALHRAD